MNTTYTEAKEAVWTSVDFIDGEKTKRAFDVVVFQVDQFTKNREHRTIVLKMNTLDKDFDVARLRRFVRRLRAIGIGFNTSIVDTRGTIFCYSKSAF